MVLSVLFEWIGLTNSALDAAKKSLDIAENLPDRFEGKSLDMWNMSKINLARLLWYE